MSKTKSVNELLSQIQSEFTNYRKKLSNKKTTTSVIPSTVPSAPSATENSNFTIEDQYIYDLPFETESSEEFYNKQVESDQESIKEYTLKCACQNVSYGIIEPGVEPSGVEGQDTVGQGIDGDGDVEGQDTTVVTPTSVIEVVDKNTTVTPTSVIEVPIIPVTIPAVPVSKTNKVTDKEKSFFN